MVVFTIFGRKPGDPEWKEEVLAEDVPFQELARITAILERRGWIIRILSMDGSKPDFISTINL